MKSRYKKFLIPVVLLLFLTSCNISSTSSDTKKADSIPQKKELKILVTNPVIKDLVLKLTEKEHKVDSLVENLDKLKDYNPDIFNILEKDYDALFYNGAGLEPFIPTLLNKLDKNRMDIVNLSRGIEILRFKMDKLESENYHYLMNSRNYQIVLFSMKNVLQELDRDRSDFYDRNFEKYSRQIDEFQEEIKKFMKGKPNLFFISESDLTAYISQEYGQNHKKILDFRLEMENPETSKASNTLKEETYLFLYTNDAALKKYSDDISKYKLKPVKIKLFDGTASLMDLYKENFRSIKEKAEE